MYLLKGCSASPLARAAHLLTTLLFAGILHKTIVSAVPIVPDDSDTDPSIDDPEWTDDLTGGVDPFSLVPREENPYPDLPTCRDNCAVDADESLFYSKVGPHEDIPQDFANQNGLKMVRDSYPEGFTDNNGDPSQSYRQFAMRFSQAFAEKTSGTAYVLLPTDGSTNIRKSVWVKIEKPILMNANGACNRIVKVDPADFSRRCVLWDRSNVADPQMSPCPDDIGPIPPAPSTGNYAPGRCGVHVTQYQKNEDFDPDSNYKFDITIFDNGGATIGEKFGAEAPTNVGVDVASELPFVLTVTAQAVDDDAVLFSYAGQNWGSNDQAHQCNFGGYEDGNRDGDCSFDC